VNRAIGTIVFAAAFLYRFADASGLVNDHFMHVVWGRQLLWGALPIRDAVSLGMPLQTGLSAVAEWLFGYRLLSEAAIISTAFAAAAVLTFAIVRRATGSIWIAVAAAAFEVALSPRTYSYPKIIVYAAAIPLLWRYVDQPSNRRAIELGLAAVLAFFLRHDHGLYLGVVVLGVIAMRHTPSLRTMTQRAVVFAAVCVLATAPYLGYVQVYGGLPEYVNDLRQFSASEHSHNPFVWPSWPLRSAGQIARWTSPEDRAVPVAIRWSPAASDDVRRTAAARHQLEVPPDGPVESGWLPLKDTSVANALAIVNDPAVEDTAGIDRVTGEIRVPGVYLGPVRVLEGLDDAPASAALLFFLFLTVSVMTALALLRNRTMGPLGQWERIKIAAVLLVAIVTFVGFVRESLTARIADAVVAPAVLGGWLAARWLAGSGGTRVSTSRRAWSPGLVARVAVLTLVLIPVTRSVAVAGAVRLHFEPAEPYSAMWNQVVTSPPFDAWPAGGSAKYRIVRYVRDCTGPREPLLVLWFAPEYYYYADRPFAGRLGAYMQGYYTSETNQRKNVAALERDRPAVAIMEAGRELTDLATHPSVLAYVAANYHELGRLPATDGTEIRVLGRNDRQPTSTQADLGWPCYR
jgi:hypothetical protein